MFDDSPIYVIFVLKDKAMTIRQLSVFIENKLGRINEVTKILAANNINMMAFSLAESADFGVLRLIVSDADKASEILKQARFGVSLAEVVALSLRNAPGALSKVMEHLAEEDVFIEYMYAFSRGDVANVVIRPTDIAKCIEALKSCDCDVLSEQSFA